MQSQEERGIQYNPKYTTSVQVLLCIWAVSYTFKSHVNSTKILVKCKLQSA